MSGVQTFLSHTARCTQSRVERSTAILASEGVERIAHRCLDCGAFATEDLPLVPKEPELPKDYA